MKTPTRGRRRTTLATALATALAAACLSALGAAAGLPAHADTPLADVTGFRTQNLSVATTGCQNVPVTMSLSTSPDAWLTDVWTYVYRGTTRVDFTWFAPNTADRWTWCPTAGFGTFRLGPSDIQAYTDSGGVHTTDTTSATFNVKARTTQALTKTARSGRYVTVTARSRYFSTNSGTYVNWPGATVTFQYRLSGTTTWKSAGTATTNSYGLATKKIYASSTRYWRTVASQTSTKWSATSAQASR
jgi:hypothetical protein